MQFTVRKFLWVILLITGFSFSSRAQYGPGNDFDGDGIINSIDIDDDNDGITDVLESVCGSLPAKSTMTVTTDLTTGGGILANILDGTNTNNYWVTNSQTTVNKSIFEFTFPSAVNLTKIEIALSGSASFLRNTVTYRIEGWNGSSYVDLTGVRSVTGTATATTTGGNAFSEVFNLSSNGGSYTKYRIYGLTGTTNSSPFIREAFFEGCSLSALNSDGDGVANQFDLDSDGDGCSDAFEAGATTNTAPSFSFPTSGVGSNGLSNSLETSPDNGVINYTSTYATYATASGSNYCTLFVSASGKVFMDFDGNSLQSSHDQEPGVKNVTVRAYKSDGSTIDAITDSLGSYSFLGGQIAGGEKVRLEFINLPAGFHDGFKGSGSNTTIQFVTGSVGAASANLALSLPGHFNSTTEPYFAAVQFKRNNSATSLATITFMDTNKTRIFVPNGATDINKEWSTPAGASAATYPIPTQFNAATIAQVGTTFGLAWDKLNNKLLTGAYMRGWSPMGTNSSANGFGEGVIYQIPISGTTASTPSVWLDLESLFGNDYCGTFVADGPHAGNGAFGKVNANPNKVGYTGLGAMKFSADGSELYVVNLNKLEVLVIPVGPGGAAPTSSSAIKRFKLPTAEAPGNWADGRPYRAVLGLGVHPVSKRVYATLTCTGPAAANLKGIVYSFNPADATPDSSDFVKELEVPLNITRPATNPNVTVWYAQTNHAWESATPNTLFYPNTSANAQHTQPWLGEITFDALPDGTFGMTIGERNHYHDLIDGSWYVTGGVLYRATYHSSTWTLENNGIAAPLTSIVNWSSAASTRAGFNTSATNKFYKYVGREGSFGAGSIRHVPGSGEVFMPSTDNVFNSGTSGIAWLDKSNGDRTRDNRLLADFSAAGYNALAFNKANNWGDIEYLGDLPTIEIGNRVWLDDDSDGIQDPEEGGITGVILNLYQGSTLVGTTTTGAGGTYYFNKTNVNLGGANGLLPNTAYEVRLNTTQAILSTYILTGTDTDGSANGDARDNDGMGTTTAVIALTTGKYGENNHTYDFGFKSNVTCTPPDAGPNMSACSNTCINLNAVSPTTGTWNAMVSNPSGATLGTTTNGVAQVCFANSATGIYRFIYSLGGGCEDTMEVNVHQPSASTSNVVICNTGSGYTWNTVNYTTSGTYTTTFMNAYGCDSVATLNLTLNNPSSSTTNLSVCTNSMPYVWNSNSLTSAGTYTYTTTNAHGCDSIATLNLTVSNTVTSSTSVDVCVNNMPYTWNSVPYSVAGTYTQSYTTLSGCDSVATLILNVVNDVTTSTNMTLCATALPYTWYSYSITTPGTYTTTLTSSAGCDSISNLVVTVASSIATNIDTTICSSSLPYSWNSTMYTSAGVYTETFNSAAGCDSVVTLTLTVTNSGSIGNYVWRDLDDNGLQNEAASEGINGVLVQLYKETSPGSGTYNLDQSTTTVNDGSGHPGYYLFHVCETANYKVKFPTTVSTRTLTSQTSTAATDGNSDADGSTGYSPVFLIDMNGTGSDKNNLTIDAGYHIQTFTLKAYPNGHYCYGQNIQLKAVGVAGGVFTWSTPVGAVVSIDNSVSGQSTLTILNLSSNENGTYSVVQSVGTNVSAPETIIVDAGAKPVLNFLTTDCIAGQGIITVDATPSANIEYAVNDGPYQSSNILTTPPGQAFVLSMRTMGSSCEVFYTGECVHCNPTGVCTNPPTDSVVAPTMACQGSTITLASFFTNVGSGTWSTSGTGVFSSTTASSSPSFVTYTPSTSDVEKGHVIVTFTTDDPDGAGPCEAVSCSKNIMLVCGLVPPIATNNTPICAGSTLTLKANGAVGDITWSGPSGYTASGDSVNRINATVGMSGSYTAIASAFGCANSAAATYATTTATVLSAPNLNVTTTANSEICNGMGNGSIDVSITGGSGNYTTCYNSTLSSCSNGPAAHFGYVAPGNYTVTVTDANCPNNTLSYPVTVNPGVVVPVPVISSPLHLCEGDNLVLNGTTIAPAATIIWTKGSSFNATGNPVVIANATSSMSGSYYAKAIDMAGCASAQVALDVTVAAKPIINHVQVNCVSGSAEMDITATSPSAGVLSYSIDGTNYQASNLFSNVPPGSLTVHVKESLASCETILQVSVPNCACPTAPVVNVNIPKVSCSTTGIPVSGSFTNVSSATWSSTGTGNFTVTTGGSPLNSVYTPSSADLALGHVYLILTTADPDGAGPCTAVTQSSYVILLDSLQTPVISTLQANYCEGDTVVMVANNVNSLVHWNGPGGYVADSLRAVINVATPGVSGIYTASVSGNGCTTKSSSYNLTVNAAPNLTITTSSTPEGCAGQGNGAIQASVAGGSGTYNVCYMLYSNCVNNTSSVVDFKWLAPGTYTVYAADAACPNHHQSQTVVVANGTVVAPPISANYNNPVCEGETLTLTAVGAPGTYLWTGPNNFTANTMVVNRTNSLVGMSGNYKVQRVENGCASDAVNLDVLVNGLPSIQSADILCGVSGEDSGRITVMAQLTGAGSLEYSLNNGAYQNSNVFDLLSNGLYSVKARVIGSDCETQMNGIELYCLCNCGKDAIVNVFPNPSTGNFMISGSLEAPSSDVSIGVYNMMGQTIWFRKLEGEMNIFSVPINIQHYAAGSYMVKVMIDGESYIKPITITDKQ